MTIRVAAIDDDRMLLGGLRLWLGPIPDVDLVLTAASVAAYVESGCAADVALLDLNLRDDSDPADNVRTLPATGARALVVSTIPEPAAVLATVGAGAAGYVSKDQDLDVLLAAIREVAAGGFVISPELAFVLSRDTRPGRSQLSPQERAVLTATPPGRRSRHRRAVRESPTGPRRNTSNASNASMPRPAVRSRPSSISPTACGRTAGISPRQREPRAARRAPTAADPHHSPHR